MRSLAIVAVLAATASAGGIEYTIVQLGGSVGYSVSF